MTQTQIDPFIANEQELVGWQSSLGCKGQHRWTSDGTKEGECADCRNTSLAFLWANKPCQSYRTELGGAPSEHAQCCMCNGSGRVPKDVGLEEVFMQAPSLGDFEDIIHAVTNEHVRAINEGGKPDYTLAALRAVVIEKMSLLKSLSKSVQ